MIIKKVWLSKASNVKLVSVPKNCDIQEGDYVKLIKIEDPTVEENKRV